MRASQISEQLAKRAESVAQMLLPNGKHVGREWTAGSTSDETGKSLKVCLFGDKAGRWSDFATGQSGDLLDLWTCVKSISLAQSIEEAKTFLGVRDRKVENPKRQFSKPSKTGLSKLSATHQQWLNDVRKISPETAAKYKLCSKGNELMFPSFADGELVFAKYRQAPQKKFRCDADCQPILFGWQIVPPNARSIVLVEGELDSMALYEYGVPALSVPFGGGGGEKQQWIDHEYDKLAMYDCIFLCMDADGPGKQAGDELIKRLGRERCRVVELPRKDANDCLMEGVSREEIVRCFERARTRDPEQLRNASEFEEEIIREFANSDAAQTGIRLPWRKVGDQLILRPGELSIWSGINGHGKSEAAGHVLASAIADGWRCCVASLEFKPSRWLKRLCRQITGLTMPSPAYLQHVTNVFREKLWCFDAVGNAKSDEILEVFAYAAKRYGIHFFVIDNLAKCGFSEDDYNGQKRFVDRLTDFAKTFDIHVALVCHMRKTDSEERPGNKMDIKGSGGITDMADTVVSVWRNKPKEEAFRQIQNQDAAAINAFKAEWLYIPDCTVQCLKQRNGEHEPSIALWFDLGSHQYLESPAHRARPIIDMPPITPARVSGGGQ